MFIIHDIFFYVGDISGSDEHLDSLWFMSLHNDEEMPAPSSLARLVMCRTGSMRSYLVDFSWTQFSAGGPGLNSWSCLLGGGFSTTPLKNDGVRQLGWWSKFPRLMGKMPNSWQPNQQPVCIVTEGNELRTTVWWILFSSWMLFHWRVKWLTWLTARIAGHVL